MKLFTSAIDKQLLAQYSKGNDLSAQKVVAKIFNPYGRGTWYLLNSDPNDPDYIWAIVDLIDIEIGSISRSELESIKVPPFRLPLERDTSFTPINAMELYKGLKEGKHYKDGGVTNYKSDLQLVEDDKNKSYYLFPNPSDKSSMGIKFKDGGKMEEGIDLFEDYDNIPNDVQEILDNYQEAFEDGDYRGLKMAHDELNKIGYTFEYYLDGQAYDLRKIGQKGKSEVMDSDDYADGGYMAKGGVTKKGSKNVTYYIGRPEVDKVGRFNTKMATWKTCVVDENGNKRYGNKSIKFSSSSASKIEVDGIKILQKEFDKLVFDGDKMAKGGEIQEYIVWVSKDGENREYYATVKSFKAAKIKSNKLWESGEYEKIGVMPKEKFTQYGIYYKDGGMTDDDGNLIDLKIGDIVVEYKKPTPNQPKRLYITKGKIISIVNAMAKVSFEPNDYEMWIPLRDLKKVNGNMADGGYMNMGGNIPKNYEVEYEINGKKEKSIYLLYPNDRVENLLPPNAKIISVKEKMSDGGYMEKGGHTYGKKKSDIDVLSTEELKELVSEERNKKIKEWYKLGEKVVIGRNDGYSFMDSSSNTESIEATNPSRNKIFDIIKNNPNITEIHFNGTIKAGKKVGEELEIVDDFDVILWQKDDSYFKKSITFEFVEDNGKYVNKIVDKKDTKTYKDRKDDTKYIYFTQLDKKYKTISEGRYNKNLFKEMIDSKEISVKEKMSDGGYMAKGGVLNEKSKKMVNDGYNLVIYTNLPSEFGQYHIVITKEKGEIVYVVKKGHVADSKRVESFTTEKDALNYLTKKFGVKVSRRKANYEEGGIMAKGGETFADKVDAVKSSLLKRNNVAPAVQKDYGKTYSPKEAEDSAKRIVGSQVAKYKIK
jgi:hypothetical protein